MPLFSRMVLWRATAIAALAYIGAIVLAFLADRLRRPLFSWGALAVAVILLAAVFSRPAPGLSTITGFSGTATLKAPAQHVWT